jgi:hypothetical protein
MLRRPMRRAVVLLPLLAVLGCGGGGHVDSGRVEKLIRNRFAVVEGVRVSDVSCPRAVPKRTGATFTCRTAGAGESRVEVVVTQRGNDRYAIVPALSPHRLEQLLTRGAFGRSTRVAVLGAKCPSGVPYRAGGTLRCQVVLAGGERVPVMVRQVDGRGGVRFSAAAIIATEVQQDIEHRLGAGERVRCPTGVPIEPGRRFACTARDGRDRNVSVVGVNAQGDVRFTVARG